MTPSQKEQTHKKENELSLQLKSQNMNKINLRRLKNGKVIPFLWIERINSVKMPIFSNAIYRFSADHFQIPMEIFTETVNDPINHIK